jgi:hypothetical protein
MWKSSCIHTKLLPLTTPLRSRHAPRNQVGIPAGRSQGQIATYVFRIFLNVRKMDRLIVVFPKLYAIIGCRFDSCTSVRMF